jgi:hypothetical protein
VSEIGRPHANGRAPTEFTFWRTPMDDAGSVRHALKIFGAVNHARSKVNSSFKDDTYGGITQLLLFPGSGFEAS